MAHRFLMKQVAQQAGVSLATVDRVIHRRPGVRQQTRIRVEQALYELTSRSRCSDSKDGASCLIW